MFGSDWFQSGLFELSVKIGMLNLSNNLVEKTHSVLIRQILKAKTCYQQLKKILWTPQDRLLILQGQTKLTCRSHYSSLREINIRYFVVSQAGLELKLSCLAFYDLVLLRP